MSRPDGGGEWITEFQIILWQGSRVYDVPGTYKNPTKRSAGMLEPITFCPTREIVCADDLPFCPARLTGRRGVPEASGSWHRRL